MSINDKNMLLADEILKILREGVTLGSDVVNYIDSTFSNPAVEELEEILQDDSNCEKDPLVELLFFPDNRLQHELEELLQSQHFQQEDEKKVVAFLCRKPLGVVFQFPEKKGSFSLEIPEEVAHQFIKRLNISKQIDRNLLLTVKENTPAKDKNRFAVKLRNSRFIETDKAIWFLSAFFESWNTDNSEAFKDLNFILSFLEELHENADIFDALMSKKKFYLKHLKRTEKFEEELQKTNIETLMLQGKNSAFMDKNEARNNMAIIDRISQTVFGKTEHFETLLGGAEKIKFRSATFEP
jgi:hypothetical protein